MESFVVGWLWKYIRGSIDPCQYGCVQGSSTVHALTDFLHRCYTKTDSAKNFAGILLLDYTKAFDLINHHVLLNKLEVLNVPGLLIQWIKSFLTNRMQQVRVGKNFSTWRSVNGGVPQGTKLGPVLFIVMINDLQTSCQTLKYVDDTTIVQIGHDVRSNGLQAAADQAANWSRQNGMSLNPEKTKELYINFSRGDTNAPPLEMDSKKIKRVVRTKLLGVTINNTLTWNEHVTNICAKASKRIHYLTQLKRAGVSQSDLIQIYKSVVRPVMEYASIVWHPGLPKYLSDELENVQRRAVRVISPSLSYNEFLATTGLPTLSQRRQDSCKQYFSDMEKRTIEHNLRNSKIYAKPFDKTKRSLGSLINWCLAYQ